MNKTDEQIKKDIVDQLYWDVRVDASDVKVDVNNKKATLKGTVPSYAARSAAEADASTISGVMSVKNLLTVKYPPDFAAPTDTEIKFHIENLLLWNPDIDPSNIIISVSAGLVTLEDTVDAYWKTIEVEKIVSAVKGVLNVTNKLAVVPTKDFLDQTIAADIVSAIDRSISVDAESVDVKINKGIVTLSGTVPDWSGYRAAINAAKYTVGVIDIDDKLVMKRI
jgi:osmotically-inducible protein OsmY